MVRQGMKHRTLLRACVALAMLLTAGSCTTPGPAPGIGSAAIEGGPPPIPREFRAAWVASVANIDWPSRTGLTSDEQKREIDQIVARASDLKLNALIVQVRPAADALYASPLEPWSEYLSGVQGQAPEPYYDPLAYWVAAAHRAGIELHAWFNPYRARHTSSRSTNAASHIANVYPGVVKDYGGYQWMDPGEEIAAQRTLDVITDVTRRYDIDGVHVDDYFYPHPVTVPGSSIGNIAPVEQ
ncbi:MAG: family 10 glycosylhydrolase [Betaproteobacteria bacterium]|nr:family 10 glycosylhydrolase [Betaproteobacteria bacterium]